MQQRMDTMEILKDRLAILANPVQALTQTSQQVASTNPIQSH
jgi:hypothetical protein